MKPAMPRPHLTALALPLLLAACGGSGGETAAPKLGYYEDVKPILDARCVGCHDGGGIAPFSLTTYADASAMKGVISAAVTSRSMPPWLAAPGCNTYVADRSLSDA